MPWIFLLCFKDITGQEYLSPSKRGNLLEDLVLMVPKLEEKSATQKLNGESTTSISCAEVTDKDNWRETIFGRKASI